MGLNTLVELLLPRHCVLCNARSEHNLCQGCYTDLPVIRDACFRCAIPLGSLQTNANMEVNQSALCGQCIKRPPAFDHTVAALEYQFPVNVLVRRFKFKRSLACGVVLSDRLSKSVESAYPDHENLPECLVPVPLHPLRQFRRVYNQAELIAIDIGKRLGIPVRSQLLRRTSRTRSQPGLTATERRKNLKDAISARKVGSSHVALVDDVMTTGATVSECASALKKAGARHVSVWVAARAPGGQF